MVQGPAALACRTAQSHTTLLLCSVQAWCKACGCFKTTGDVLYNMGHLERMRTEAQMTVIWCRPASGRRLHPCSALGGLQHADQAGPMARLMGRRGAVGQTSVGHGVVTWKLQGLLFDTNFASS